MDSSRDLILPLDLSEREGREFGNIEFTKTSQNQSSSMQRRDVLRLLATGAALQLAPHKLFAVMREVRSFVHGQPMPRTLNAHQFATVKAMAEMILPRTDTPGATDVGVAEFIDLILTEWYDESERNRFLAGLADVDSRSNSLFGKELTGCTEPQQSQILSALGEKMVEDQDARQRTRMLSTSNETDFYPMLRQLTLTAYYTSEAGATQELHFEIIPGVYQGCNESSPIKEARDQK